MYEAGTVEQKAHLNARLNPFASCALKPIRSLLTEQHRINDFQTQSFVAHATMKNPWNVPDTCECRAALTPTHALCCKQGSSAWLHRHNTLQHTVAGFARKQGLSVEANERKTFEHAQQKSKSLEPDLTFIFQKDRSGLISVSQNQLPPLWFEITALRLELP